MNVISEILESYVRLFVEMLRHGVYNQEFFDGMKLLFEYDSILHKFNYSIPEEQLKSLRSAN